MRTSRCTHFTLLSGLMVILLSTTVLRAQDDFEDAPIAYSTSQADNIVSRLQNRLDSKTEQLTYDDQRGYLKSVLEALNIPEESQTLVFSKTSLQLRRISPRTPRAIYFNDEAYVGFCQSGDVIEVSAVDPQLGAVFYTLDQHEESATPKFERRVDNCLVCHASSRTEGVPGHLIRSLYVESSGHPVLSAGSRNVNHTTPIEDRWGGWYVTGEHGSQKHLGNLIVEDDFRSSTVDNSSGLNVTSLTDLLDTSRYLTPHSDIVALMILEHQVLVQNRITNANYATRQALDYDAMMNKVLEKPAGNRLESTTRRIHSAGDKLVEALLLCEEAPLTAQIKGTSGYAELFQKQGPRDSHGRSLRELDLKTRMFKYPCSYLIYSEAFAKLPNEMRTYVLRRLGEVLTSKETDKKYAHLSTDDRQAIREILTETLPDLPAAWLQ